MPKILFICKNRTDVYGYGYGKSVGLINSSTFIINYLHSIGIESKLSIVTDANSIDKEVFNYKPSHVIIEALWVTPEKIKELIEFKRYSKISWIVRLHSKIPFIANEGIAFSWIVNYARLMKNHRNLYLSVNSKEFMQDLHNIFHVKCLYLPNIYYPKSNVISKTNSSKSWFDIGCFGAIRPMKNQLIQAVASIEYGDVTDQEIHFHINADRQEQFGDNVYKNLKALFDGTNRHKLIEHPWLNHEEFIKLVVTMDIGLQVSMSETFNIVAADFISNDIPLIGSKDINWMPSMFTANPNSSNDILNKIRLIIDTKELGFYKLNKIYLNWNNNKSKKIWKDYLKIV